MSPKTGPRRVVVAAVVWLAAVAAVATLAWFAIDSAGRQVTTSGSGPVVRPTASPAGTPSPAATPTTSPTSSPSASPSRTATRPPSASASRPSAGAASGTPRPTAASPVVGRRTTDAGTVRVTCRGEVPEAIAVPTSGWSVHENYVRGSEVEIEFKAGESEVKVKARCGGATVRFTVQEERDDD